MTTWASATAYTVGTRVQPTTANGYNYRCVTAGTSGGSEPEWPTLLGARVTDGTAVWACVSAVGAEIQKLAASAIIELFELDSTALGGGVSRFHCGTNQLAATLTWQGNQYTPVPMKAAGFEFNGSGKLPRPRLQIANISGLVSALTLAYGDLLGAKVTRKRTLLKYLDAVNFPGGVNPDADPAAEFPDDVYFVDRKSVENKVMVEFELAPAFDVTGVKLPRRQIVQNVCAWTYRSSECSFAGRAVAEADDTEITAYLNLPGVNGNYASTPDSVANSIAGNLDVRVKATMPDWTPSTFNRSLAGKYSNATDAEWLFDVTTGGLLLLYLRQSGSAVSYQTTVTHGIADGATSWVRFTANFSTGIIQFFKSSDYDPETESGNWVQIGSNRTTVLTALASTAAPLTIGAYGGTGAQPFNGFIHYMELRNGINGTVVAKFDPRDAIQAATSFESIDTGETWTINQSGGTPAALVFSGADRCGKRLASCRLRFGENAVLPYGGFPAAGLVR